MSAKSEVGRVYDELRLLGFTHFEIRAMLLYQMHYSRADIRNVMRNRLLRIKATETEALTRLRNSLTANPRQSGLRLLEMAWPTRPIGQPLYEYAILKIVIQEISDPDFRRVLLRLAAPLRNLERREGISKWNQRELRGHLSVRGRISSPIKTAWQQRNPSEPSYVGGCSQSQSRQEMAEKHGE